MRWRKEHPLDLTMRCRFAWGFLGGCGGWVPPPPLPGPLARRVQGPGKAISRLASACKAKEPAGQANPRHEQFGSQPSPAGDGRNERIPLRLGSNCRATERARKARRRVKGVGELEDYSDPIPDVRLH
jgi:hypothetical protein